MLSIGALVCYRQSNKIFCNLRSLSFAILWSVRLVDLVGEDVGAVGELVVGLVHQISSALWSAVTNVRVWGEGAGEK